jgi:hypothetical protein
VAVTDHEATQQLYDLIAGRLADEGWPEPYHIAAYPFATTSSIIWRRGDKGSALVLETERGGLAVRHTIKVQILCQERFIMIDLTSPLAIWPGDHNALTLIEVLRHFKSVVA